MFQQKPGLSQTLGDFMDEIENDLGGLRYGIGKEQFKYIEAQIRKYAFMLLHEIGGSDQLDFSHRQLNASQENWWWFIDTWLAERRKAGARRVLMIGGIVIGVLLALVLVYHSFLAPDPATQARYAHEVGAQQAMINGNYTQAMNEINQRLQVAPDDFELLVLKGVTLQKLGQESDAQEVFTQAEKRINDKEQYLTARALVYLQVSNPQAALLDTQEILKINPGSPEAYFYAAQAYQGLNNNPAPRNAQAASKMVVDVTPMIQ